MNLQNVLDCKMVILDSKTEVILDVFNNVIRFANNLTYSVLYDQIYDFK